MKTRIVRHRRSSAALLLSGSATLSFDQRLRGPAILSAEDAFRRDREMLTRDAKRVLAKLGGSLESA